MRIMMSKGFWLTDNVQNRDVEKTILSSVPCNNVVQTLRRRSKKINEISLKKFFFPFPGFMHVIHAANTVRSIQQHWINQWNIIYSTLSVSYEFVLHTFIQYAELGILYECMQSTLYVLLYSIIQC